MDSCSPNSAEKYATGRGRSTPALRRAPGAVGVQIFLLAAIGVVDPAVQHEFARRGVRSPPAEFRSASATGLLIQLPPAHRIQIAKEAGGIVIPTPPEIAGQRPEPLLRGRDEAIESACLAHDRARPARPPPPACGLHLRRKLRGSMVCTTRTPCRTPRSISGNAEEGLIRRLRPLR